MSLNSISKAVVLQLNTPNCDSSEVMKKITSKYDELITFGSIHPSDDAIDSKIQKHIKNGVKGWKIAPHVIKVNIDDQKTISLLKSLSKTKLPIISCSGVAFPKENLGKIPKGTRESVETQDIKRFHNVLKEIHDLNLIFAHGGIYQIDAVIELMKKYPNTSVEISTQTTENIRKLINKAGSERILYGTDYPTFNHVFSVVAVLRATKD